jgi:hypothetical protein
LVTCRIACLYLPHSSLSFNRHPIPHTLLPLQVLQPDATNLSYTEQSDVYGLSIVLAELILLELPFGDLPNLVTTQEWLRIITVEYKR